MARTILEKARSHNPQAGITGALCSGNGSFMQVIEGERAAISQLYQRIAADPRHTRVELIEAAEVHERHFGGWAMGFAAITEAKVDIMRRFGVSSEFRPAGLGAAGALRLAMELRPHLRDTPLVELESDEPAVSTAVARDRISA